MKILFTGASSFSGYWFIKRLIEFGHEVTGTLTKSRDDYVGIRRTRVKRLDDVCQIIPNAKFGTNVFIGIVRDFGPWDILCHHAAQTTNYKNFDFDWFDALKINTNQIDKVLLALQANNCNYVVFTGSVFEADEGIGEQPIEAFSAYGLSKTLSWHTLRFKARKLGMKTSKFIIPNVFGPLEDERFTTYLAKCWLAGKKPIMQTPLYIRDNVPVSLLSYAYNSMIEETVESKGEIILNPSFYAESQADFAYRFAREMSPRLGFECEIELSHQQNFLEPIKRINQNPLNPKKWSWDEKEAWDDLAKYYLTLKR